MNKVFLYTTFQQIDSVDFIFFDNQNIPQDTVPGSLNIHGVWEAEIPSTLEPGIYLVVGQYNSVILGKETINWDGVDTLPDSSSMVTDLYRLSGLDSKNPLNVSRESRTVGNKIIQDITNDSEITTVTRL